jgi:hypothetical protein
MITVFDNITMTR